MKIHHLGEENSLLNHFIREIRSVEIQGDPLRFRRNLERIGEIMAYEISKTLDYTTVDVRTPLGVAQTGVATDGIVVASILRAGLPLHNGVLSYFDHAENCFVSAYRKYTDETHFDVHVEYIASPCLDGKTVILCDTMLATGSSMELAYRAILTRGTPKRVAVCSILASRRAVDYIASALPPETCDLWVAAIDPELNSHAYIVPGLGDAGDLAFGAKMD
ncbi:MAG: uracil phosphoribosyltransferase [bacterium]|uniref:Uracil phosphoribosyltransferase n=1 Tax=Candidatus Aphodosoma intestinipullorum TaxID=2840674 RepID=A0A940DLB4_9BACT|nr:uracil phosphoribosyltransferase [Candidatus Aphodosoma intestinipullorum]